MEAKDQFVSLADQVSSNAQILSSFAAQRAEQLSRGDRPSPSLQGLFVDEAASDEVQRARKSLREAIWELQWLSAEPAEWLEQTQLWYIQFSCLQWLLRFQVLHHIPLTEDGASWETVALAAKVPLSKLKSIARMAITFKFLREPNPDMIAHSYISAQFVQQPQYHALGEWFTRFAGPIAFAMGDATARWGDTTAKNETAFNVAFNTELPFFDYIATSSELTDIFAKYMRNLARSDGLALKHLLDGFDWAHLGEANVVDLGGSAGHVSIPLLKQYPQLHCTVQDLPGTIAGAKDTLSTLPDLVQSRLAFAAHNFFDPEPTEIAENTDLFLLRRILHDWADKEALAILQHLANALLKPGASILVMDTILPTPGTVPPMSEAMLRWRDLTMMHNFNGGERELGDWERLFEQTSPKLKIRSYRIPEGSFLGLMEVVRAE